MLNRTTGLGERIQGRLDQLDLTPEDAAQAAGLALDFIRKLQDGNAAPPRGKPLAKLAEALATSVSYLEGLDPQHLSVAATLQSCGRG